MQTLTGNKGLKTKLWCENTAFLRWKKSPVCIWQGGVKISVLVINYDVLYFSDKIILIVTAEVVYHKSPVVRTTVSRILAYTVERMGVLKALNGGKEITDKLLPAIAKLAQDGSPEARNYAKSSLHKMLMEHPDFEKILKKSLTPNTMRNLEKIIEALKNPHHGSGGGFSSRTRSRGSRASRLKTL